VWTENDDEEVEYGRWHHYEAKDTLVEEDKVHPIEKQEDIWPDWREGRPTTFRRTGLCDRFSLDGVYHEARFVQQSLELRWNGPHMLSVLRGNSRLLPQNYDSEWSGVYRIFSPNTIIDRCCGKDPTGTLYVRLAGASDRKWSILRGRIAAIVNGSHQAIEGWGSCNLSQRRFPWNSLAAEWAYTGTRLSPYGKSIPEAKMAEGFLLSSYRDSYGEYPPWNLRG
jgi:hypothetical protein